MSDTILGALSQNNQQPNQVLDRVRALMNSVRFAQNPKQEFMRLIQNNPQYSQIYQLMTSSGKSEEQFFYALAQKMGIDPNMIISGLRQ